MILLDTLLSPLSILITEFLLTRLIFTFPTSHPQPCGYSHSAFLLTYTPQSPHYRTSEVLMSFSTNFLIPGPIRTRSQYKPLKPFKIYWALKAIKKSIHLAVI